MAIIPEERQPGAFPFEFRQANTGPFPLLEREMNPNLKISLMILAVVAIRSVCYTKNKKHLCATPLPVMFDFGPVPFSFDDCPSVA